MSGGRAIEDLRWAIPTTADAIRFACILEATAPKPGNVHPAASFGDLRFVDFVLASECIAVELTRPKTELGDRIYEAVWQTRQSIGTNVNLGIVLLIAPLVVAAELRQPVANVLENLSAQQGRRIGQAIAMATPGGMDSTAPDDSSQDIRNKIDPRFDLMSAMRMASSHDSIAAQYAGGFEDLLEHVVPLLRKHIGETGDFLSGITRTSVELLAERGDSLIRRKQGSEVSLRVQQAAQRIVRNEFGSLGGMDRLLRSDGNQLNPGTTADLIAAALFLVLRP